MTNKLVRYMTGDSTRPSLLSDKQTRSIYDEARIAALKVDGAVALAGHAMQTIVVLDDRRVSLSQGDPVKNQVLADIELEAVRQIKSIQSRLFNNFGV